MSDDPKKNSILDIHGCTVMPFVSGELVGVQEMLEAAGGVISKRKSESENVKRFKLACAINETQIIKAVDILDSATEKLMEPDTDIGAEELKTLEMEIEDGFSKIMGDQAVDGALCDLQMAVMAFVLCDKEARAEYRKVLGQGKIEELEGKLSGVTLRHADILGWYTRQFGKVCELANRRMDVEVVRVSWPTAPMGISGSYLRALSWMFADLPERFKKLLTDDLECPTLDSKEGGVEE